MSRESGGCSLERSDGGLGRCAAGTLHCSVGVLQRNCRQALHATLNVAPVNDAPVANNDYFTVLRSADGFRFEPILRVDGAGNSATAIRYADVDEQPLQGLSYYKLRQTDLDGSTSESQVVAVRFSANKGGSLVAWPNPAESELNLAGFGGAGSEVRIMDTAGHVVLLERITSDTDRIVLSVQGLARGSYSVQVLSDGGLNSLPVVLH